MSFPVTADKRPPQRLALLCHAIRWCAVGWLAVVVGLTLFKWGDKAEISRIFSRILKRDLGELPPVQYAAGHAIALGLCALAALVVVFLWRLFGRYLDGRIFDQASVTEMRRLGWAGIAIIAADIAARPLLSVVLSSHLGPGQKTLALWTDANDLLHVVMALFIIALASVFKTGVEIAEDNRQIV